MVWLPHDHDECLLPASIAAALLTQDGQQRVYEKCKQVSDLRQTKERNCKEKICQRIRGFTTMRYKSTLLTYSVTI